MSDKFTQADADRIHDKWRGILGIKLSGRIELVDRLDGDRIAECAPNIARNRYLIRLSNPDFRTGSETPDIDDDVCHECLHVLTWFCCQNIQDTPPIANEVYEQFVDHMASVLVSLHRGQQ